MATRFASKAIVLFVLSGPSAADEVGDAKGSICLAAVQDDDSDRGYFSEHFTVRVDRSLWHSVPVKAELPRMISGLAGEGKHLVAIRDGDRTIESFWFDFDSAGSRELCLWYKEWYRSWSLTPVDGRGKDCRCPSIDPIR